MDAGLMVLSGTVFLLLVFVVIGGPGILADWFRNRRQETIMRQIAVTDAIDGRFGPIVAPVVQKPLWGPWRIRMAVPFTRPAAVGTILAIAHEVLAVADRMNPGRYEIVLTPKEDSTGKVRETRASRSPHLSLPHSQGVPGGRAGVARDLHPSW
jgi:hypothetical protein